MSGGDLEGGRDELRNADVRALKALFYQEEAAATAASAAMEAAQLGLLKDIPLARFQMVLLPHQQAAFNIFQPQLVHCFETLLATEPPWLYLHALLPGGADNLGNPEFALPGLGADGGVGSQATLQGTLMQVVAFERRPDARISLVCQGVARAAVVRGTQALPYSRADVQLLPDAEQLASAVRSARLRERGAGCEEVSLVALTAAIAEEHCWREYEFAPVGIESVATGLAPFASFNPAEATACARAAAKLAATADAGNDAGGGKEEEEEEEEEDECGVLEGVMAEAMAAAGDESENESESSLELAELQVWLELDALFRTLKLRRGGPMPAPAQLLSLLPCPPAAGWPDAFQLDEAANALRESALRESPATADGDASEPFVPHSKTEYASRRRQQRLSCAVWPVLSRDNNELQRALEATSTKERLRLAARKVRELREQL